MAKNEPETLMPRRSKDDGNFYTSEEMFYAQQNCFYQSANHIWNTQGKQIIQISYYKIKSTKITTKRSYKMCEESIKTNPFCSF